MIGRNVRIPSFAWKGAIDEISFYNRALSQAEIQSVVDAGGEGKQATIVITTAADEDDGSATENLGAGTSLREAIAFANANPGKDAISFNIPGSGLHTISLLSELPAITEAVIIDGYTQPGASPNTLASGNDAVILIELDGTNAGEDASGLTVTGGGSTIRGLAINRLAESGIRLESSDNVVTGSFIGTDVTGILNRGNGEGVAIVGAEDDETDPLYSNDFEGSVGEEWSTGETDVTPVGNRRFLGQFGSETATLTLNADDIDQDNTTAITVEFDLFVLRTWNGNHNGSGSGPDRWSLTLGNGMSLLDTTFSNNHPNSGFAGQAYPGVFGSGQFDPRTGAEENNTLGFLFGNDEYDSVYHLSFTFSYTGGDVVLKFAGALTTPGIDESWGLDNVEVRAIAAADSAPNDYSLDSNPNGVWTYGWTSTLGGTLHPYPDAFTAANGIEVWIENAIQQAGTPAVVYNPTAGPVSTCCTIQPGQINFHPGPNGEQSVVRWTAPADDTVKVAAFFVGIDGSPTTTDAHVLHNGVSLFDGVVNRLYAGPYFDTTLDVQAGDTIDFVVGTGGNGFISDSTALDAVIVRGASRGPADGNVIGGTSPANQNIVAYSGGDGIRTTNENSSATIVGNSIFANGASGIDLASDDPPAPVIASLTSFPAELALTGSLDAEASTKYRIEFFANAAPDPSGFGEGQRLLGVRGVTTDASGHIAFGHELPPVAAGEWITATATRVGTDGETLLETSEFSEAVQAIAAANADLEVTISDSPDPVILGDSVTYTVSVTNHGPATATGVLVVAHGPVGQAFNSVSIPVGGLFSGASSSFQLVFTPEVLGTFSATATVIANEDDPNLTNNSFTQTALVRSRLTFELAQAQYEVREGEAFAVLTVRKLGDFDSSGNVEFTTVNGTAGQRGIGTAFSRVVDFTTTSGELFFRGKQNVATIRVPIGDDSILEPDESFRVVLSNPSAGAELGAITSAEVIIHDNDPTLSFVTGSMERNEGLTGRTTIEVRLQPASSQTVTVVYAADGGSATQGTDYTLTGSRTLTFRPGETRKFINFNTVNDTLFEGNETAFIELSSPINAFLGEQARHRVTIVDNDPEPPPADPGSNPSTALAIDLATLPRQSYRQYLGKGDVDTYKVTLGPLERLALDVDPSTVVSSIPGLPSSKLKILDGDGVRVLANIGASAEPEGGQVTNNAAHLFQADADGGTYYIQLSTTATGKSYGYSLGFHRIGVSEKVPSPDKLNASGPMYAWFDGVDTVGITGPTGYGFTLEGPWERQVTTSGKSALKSQKLTLETGDQFTLKGPQGVELPLVANGTITISTQSQRWGDVFGVVATDAISFPVALSIVPINNLLADVFGSSFATVGLLGGDWRISLGGDVFNILGAAIDATQKIDQLLPGVPYLRKFGGSTVDAHLGIQRLGFSQTPMNWIIDPADPMLMVKVPGIPFTDFHGAALAVSMHGLLKFKPKDAPDPAIDAGVTEFAGHIYAQAAVGLKIGPVPVDVDGDIVLNVDADRDGRLLGDLRDVQDVFDIFKGDFSEVREILNDIQLGVNGAAVIAFPNISPFLQAVVKMEAGRASFVLNGLTETVWVRGQQGGAAFPDTPLETGDSGIVWEGLIDFGGEFFFAMTTSSDVGGIELGYKYTVSNEGISASIFGSIGWSADIDYGGGTVSGKAKATITAEVAIEIDDDGDVHLSGSISARGRLTAKIGNRNKELFDDSIEAQVRSKGFRFKFPLGVGNLDLDLFH